MLLLPSPLRDVQLVLRAYHRELCTVTARATEPALAEVRLQWWADGLRGEREGELASHPIGSALLLYLDEHAYAREPLAAKAEAHSAELYADAFPDANEFEGYCGETRSILTQLLLAAEHGPGGPGDASGHHGVVETVTERIAASPILAARGLEIAPPGVNGFAAYGLKHVEKARAAGAIGSIFAPLNVFEFVLRRAQADPDGARGSGVAIGQLREQWLLWRGRSTRQR